MLFGAGIEIVGVVAVTGVAARSLGKEVSMSVVLHRVVRRVSDRHASAAFFADLLTRARSAPWGPFLPVEDSRGVTFDFVDDSIALAEERWTFMVDQGELDAIVEQLRSQCVVFWADPGRSRRGEVANRYGGRQVFLDDADGDWSRCHSVRC
jgi:hypothetical protein